MVRTYGYHGYHPQNARESLRSPTAVGRHHENRDGGKHAMRQQQYHYPVASGGINKQPTASSSNSLPDTLATAREGDRPNSHEATTTDLYGNEATTTETLATTACQHCPRFVLNYLEASSKFSTRSGTSSSSSAAAASAPPKLPAISLRLSRFSEPSSLMMPGSSSCNFLVSD